MKSQAAAKQKKEGIRMEEKKQSDLSVLLGYAGSYKKLQSASAGWCL